MLGRKVIKGKQDFFQALEAPAEIAGPFLSRAVSKIRMRGYLTRMNAQFRKVVDTLLP